MPNIGPGELILILLIALVVIGPGRLPDVGSALGKSIREFRKASSDMADATRIDTSPLPPAPPQPNVLSNPAPVSQAAEPPAPTPVTPAQTAPTIPAPIAVPPTTPSDETTTSHTS